MYKNLYENLNILLEDYKKVEKKFNLSDSFKKDKKSLEQDTDIDRIKAKIKELRSGEASLDDLENLVKDIKAEVKKEPEKK